MIETHPLKPFVPKNAQYLLLGSFVTKEAFYPNAKQAYVWYYANGGRNQFWPILGEIYGVPIDTLDDKKLFLSRLKMAVSDIIYQCERKKLSSLDTNLVNIVYAHDRIAKILRENSIKTIYFTSRFVEDKFRKNFKACLEEFPEANLVTLPSPSPRYTRLTKSEKSKIYKKLLPKLITTSFNQPHKNTQRGRGIHKTIEE